MRCRVIVVSALFVSCVVNAQSTKEKADQYFATGNFTKSIETYKTLEVLDDVYDDIAKAYIAIGNYGEGLSYYKKAISVNPEDFLLRYQYAKLLSKTKDFKEAQMRFTALIENDSLNPNFHYELGIILEKLKDTTALNSFKIAYKLDPTHQKAIFKIAKKHLIKRRFKEAHTIIDKGLESYSDNVELISLKAQTYYHQEYYTHAVVWFQKLLELGEKSEFIHEKLSLSYAQNSDYKEAIYHREEALKYNPHDANAMFVLGDYYAKLDDFEKAEDYYKKSLKLRDVSLSNEYQKLGIVLNRQKKHKEAIKAFQKAQKENPDDVMNSFFILRTKDEYYADIDTKIKLYEDFLNNKESSPLKAYAERRLKELKEEKFLERD
jgi:tetratricopeptide (TPR) repeat protein